MNLVVGTAGHVDHGKSSLVLALTGTDPDRLAEEKRRGMTIELGFAQWTLPSGERVGVVDVPGHQRFVRTMVAGAQGIDLVLLVVAADEGVMPQTREHLAICGLLGARRAVVALTKCDLVDEDVLGLARAEVEEVIAASPLRGAPVVACSSLTGEGLDELGRTVEAALGQAPPRVDRGRPRLFVDRAFALPGFGPIVTGTLETGTLHAGEEVSLLPGGLRARIRGLERHGERLERAEPGGRTAVNLAGVERAQLGRGMALVAAAAMGPVQRLDARLEVLDDAPAGIRHNATVSLHLGTSEVAARVWLLDGAAIEPGAAAYAQLQLAAPLAAAPGDRLVLRRMSPQATLGGGVVLDSAPRRHRRRDPAVAAALGRLEEGGLRALLLELLARQRLGSDPAALARAAGAGRGEVDAVLSGLGEGVVQLGRRLLAPSRWEELRRASTALLTAFHDTEPLRPGMPREEWRSRLRLPGPLSADVVHRLRAEAGVVEDDGCLALAGRGRRLSGRAEQTIAEVLAVLTARGLDPPPMAELRAAGLTPGLLRVLVDDGRAVRLSAEVVVAGPVFAAARARVEEHLRAHGEATVAQIRDAVGATRRVVVPLLETLDATRVTVRSGDLRRLRAPARSQGEGCRRRRS
ncbi:MAG TPA: selenocysteine-specific translation elongation factor [Candidatus Dormibacteraeota bacterium]|nr:selenocysteine-specific translation elongation factor [Candidatus Dormibacteraeota bacterium]